MRLIACLFATAFVASLIPTYVNAQAGDDRREEQGEPYHKHHDSRYGHDHVYPDRGAVVRDVPRAAVVVNYAGVSYKFDNGVWYEPRGPAFVVIDPPIGLIVPALPGFANPVTHAGETFLYVNNVYYRARPELGGYEVVNEPGEMTRSSEATEDPAPGGPRTAHATKGSVAAGVAAVPLVAAPVVAVAGTQGAAPATAGSLAGSAATVGQSLAASPLPTSAMAQPTAAGAQFAGGAVPTSAGGQFAGGAVPASAGGQFVGGAVPASAGGQFVGGAVPTSAGQQMSGGAVPTSVGGQSTSAGAAPTSSGAQSMSSGALPASAAGLAASAAVMPNSNAVGSPPPPSYGAPAAAFVPAQNGPKVFIYPRSGQNSDQQARDRYECYRFAVAQTGVDPMRTNGGAQRSEQQSDYERAQAACLEGRGYSVR